MDTDRGSEPRGRRRPLVLAVGALALALLVWAVVAAVSDTPASVGSSASPTPGTVSPDPTEAPETTPGELTDTPSESATPGVTADPVPTDLAELLPVTPEEEASTDTGLVFAIERIDHVQGEAIGPGEIAGPAVRFTISIANGGRSDFDLATTAVNAYVGEDRQPAEELTNPGGRPFEGVVGPGETVTGVYLFVIDEDDRSDVTLVVDHAVDSPAVVFRGDVA